MMLLRPLPRPVTRSVSFLMLCAWVATMAVLVHRTLIEASSGNLATDLARYGKAAQWRGIYYRNEKIGFTVSQIVQQDDGFELQEDGRLQMSLLGAQNVVSIRTTARVDRGFAVRAFDFSLDPGTGGTKVHGEVSGRRLHVVITTAAGSRIEDIVLAQPPVLTLTLPRRLADAGLVEGAHHEWTIFDPATLANATIALDVGRRELVNVGRQRLPAFRVETAYAGLRTISWITDTGEIVRETSPLGLETVREAPADAQNMAVPSRVSADLLSASAIVPDGKARIVEPRDVRRLRLRLSGAEVPRSDLAGVGQSVDGNVVEIRDAQGFTAEPSRSDAELARFLLPEPLIESDAPEIRAEAEAAVRNVTGARAQAERLTRHVNAILDKKPTVSLPSAREVLRTKVGDCNEHTALYVAMARALGIPARIAVGLVSVRGAFYYHAWPEVYLAEGRARGLWLPVDPTLNQFPADATHLRLARGGLDKQAAILPLIGRLRIEILELETAPNTSPIVVGRTPGDDTPLRIAIPTRAAGDCWSVIPERRRRRP
jgi:transglutaminase-like putative cysteine protease